MPAVFQKTVEQDLHKPLKIQYCADTVFTKDNAGNQINVLLFEDGEPYNSGGTVSATAIRADGATESWAGTISGNTVSVALTRAALDVPGTLQVFIKVTAGTVETTVYAGVYNVVCTETPTVVAPVTPSDVAALIASIEAAIRNIPADWTSFLGTIAPTFDPAKADGYAAGAYVWYPGQPDNVGTLYRFTAPHSGTWTGTDAVTVVIGNELNDTVRYTQQAKTDAEKTIARANIGAADADDVVDLELTTVQVTPQTFDDNSKSQARSNIGAASSGDLSALSTIVNNQGGYISDLNASIGTVPTGETVEGQITDLKSAIGNKSNLNTDTKENIVAAINEVNGHFLDGIEEGVAAWLDDHPEATTTVQDGSLTEAKFEADTLLAIKNGYVTPEMYEAAGDGTTDDTAAIQAAIASGKPVLGINNYLISDTVTISNGKTVIFTGIIIYDGERTKPAVAVTGRFNNVRINTIVDKSAYDVGISYDGGWHGWESDNYIGLDINNAHQSIIQCKRIVDFTVGVRIAADVNGNFQNTISGKAIMNCKYGIYILTTGANGWLNSSTIDGFEIVNSSRSWDGNHAGTTRQYGVYQELSDNNTYGARYLTFNNLVFELTTRDYFTGFYFKLICNSRFCNTVSEITSNAQFAEFYIYKTTAEQITSLLQYSYDNRFENTGFMGGNKTITFSGDKKAIISSLKKVVCFDTDTWMEIFSDYSFYGKALVTNSTKTQSVVKGYSFTPTRHTGTLATAKKCRTEDGMSFNNTTKRVLSGAAYYAISLMIPVSEGESYRICVQGNKNENPNVMLKAFDANGDFITPTGSVSKVISGNFYADTSTYNSYMPFVSNTQEYEFTIVDSTVAFIVILVYGSLTGLSISSCDAQNAVVYRHWGDFEYLNFAGKDKFVTNSGPSSTTDSDATLYVGQRLYDGRSLAQLGNYWEYTASGWVYSSQS